MGRSLLLLALPLFIAPFLALSTVDGEDWNYVSVRPGAHMFWWLYSTTSSESAPLVMWLQGGPGASSTGFGNFMEIGPLDLNQKPRPDTWVAAANLLFVDNPVGTGFSYVENDNLYTTNETQIASDLVALLSGFLKQKPEFTKTPFYIFSESYGGKMAASFAQALYDAVASKSINCNFAGVALGDSWISPVDFVMEWTPYLIYTSEMDPAVAQGPLHLAAAIQKELDLKHYANATNLWGLLEEEIGNCTNGVNWYNILDRSGDDDVTMLSHVLDGYLRKTSEDPLTALMNGPVREKLGIIPSTVTWGGQADNVQTYLEVDFMKDVISTVDYLLLKGVDVTVYSGNLDLICCTPGTLAWMNRLLWQGLPAWQDTVRSPFMVNGTQAGYTKDHKNLHMYFIFASGHMVPADQPATALEMLKDVITK